MTCFTWKCHEFGNVWNSDCWWCFSSMNFLYSSSLLLFCVGMAVAQVAAFYSVMMVKRIYGWVILFLYSDGHGGPRKWCEREARFYIKTIIFSSWTFLMVFQSTIQSIMDLLLGHGAWVCVSEWYCVCTDLSSFTSGSFFSPCYLFATRSSLDTCNALKPLIFSPERRCRPKNIRLWWEKRSSPKTYFSGGGENSQSYVVLVESSSWIIFVV